MKNIERLEVQGVIISVMLNQISLFDGMDQFKNLGFKTEIMIRGDFYPYIFKDLTKWFNSEYIEPHKWEPWELEFLKHTNKKYLWACVSGNGYVWLYTDKPHKSVSTDNYIGQSYTDTQTKFDTLQYGEIIPIEEELERNGMHR